MHSADGCPGLAKLLAGHICPARADVAAFTVCQKLPAQVPPVLIFPPQVCLGLETEQRHVLRFASLQHSESLDGLSRTTASRVRPTRWPGRKQAWSEQIGRDLSFSRARRSHTLYVSVGIIISKHRCGAVALHKCVRAGACSAGFIRT